MLVPSGQLPQLQKLIPKHSYGQSHKVHTTGSWRVQVIPGILQAGDNSILQISAVRSRIRLGTLAVDLSSSKYQPQRPLLFCFTWPGTNSLLTSHMAELQHRNHPSTTRKPHRHRVEPSFWYSEMLLQKLSTAAKDTGLWSRHTSVWLSLSSVLEGRLQPTNAQYFLHNLWLTWYISLS